MTRLSKVVGIIPVRMASSRLPGKPLLEIAGLPMVEHVRLRALASSALDEVIVATCDQQIFDVVVSLGGSALMTSRDHQSGTSRVSEALRHIDCTHVVLLQGDEPLVPPEYISELVEQVKKNPNEVAWNLVASIDTEGDAYDLNNVKCICSMTNKIIWCFRKINFMSDNVSYKHDVQKLLGVMAYRRDFLCSYDSFPETRFDQYESIEQLRILEMGFDIRAVKVDSDFPSVNTPEDFQKVMKIASNNN